MKKLINDPDSYLLQGLRGFGRAHADLVRVDLEQRIIVRREAPRAGKVGLVSGGGSGHEPLHGGFVGLGMLDAACPGEVFTSPPPDPIVAATQAVDAGAGVVHIVKNYTGDVMNFQIAAELAADEGITVETVLVDDDVAVQDSLYTAGRRGTGATVLVEKIAGACAEAGGSLADVVALGQRVAAQSRSFGVALTSCTTPAAGRPTFDIGPDEMEFGVGHSRRAGPSPRADPPGQRDRPRDDGRDPVRAEPGRAAGAGVRERPRWDAARGVVPRVRRAGPRPRRARASRSAGRSSATTSPAWTWPAPRSPC